MSDDKIFAEYAQLVRRIKSGDEGACDEIYNKSKRLVYATCYGILNNNEDAQDAMQETYMTVFTKIDELSDESKFLGWLKRVAASKSLDMYRKKRGDISYDEIPVTEGDDDLESLPDAYIMEKTKRDILNQIIRRELSDVQYQTILLYYYDELPIETIAKLMNCPEGTVKTRLKSSRIKIKAAIEEYEDKNKDYFAAFTGVPFLAKFFMEIERNLNVPQVKLTARRPSSGKRPYENTKVARKAVTRGARKTAGKTFISTIGGKIAVGAAAIVVLATGTIVVKTIIDKMDEPGSNRHSEKEADDEEVYENEETEEITETSEPSEETEPTVVIYDEPVELNTDEVPEYDQLTRLIGRFDIPNYDCNSVPDDFINEFMFTDGGIMIDLSTYFDDYSSDKGVSDPLGLFDPIYCSKVNYDYLVWTEENILNISSEDIERINVFEEVPSEYGAGWGHYLNSDGYIYMAKGEAGDSVSEEIIKITFDGEYYYVISNVYDMMFTASDPNYDPMEDGTKYLNVMLLKEIDGKYYWSFISRSVTTLDASDNTSETEQVSAETVDLTGDVDFRTLEDNGWKAAYLERIDSLTKDDFGNGQMGISDDYTMGYDLVFINDDQIPELVCCLNEDMGTSWINIYTYANDETIKLGNSMYRYKIDITYVPAGNMIGAGGGISDAGAAVSSMYWMMSDDCTILETIEYCSYAYDRTKYSNVQEAIEAGEYEEGVWYNYIYDPETDSLIEISEEENSRIDEELRNQKSLYTTKTLDQFKEMIG